MDIRLLQKEDLSPKSFTNDDSNAQGGVAVRISPDVGNNLELRENGLYLGNLAQADLRFQYVDAVSGNDNNSGSREAPLKTIQAALRRLPSGSIDNIVYCHDEQTHIFHGKDKVYLDASVALKPYGTKYDEYSLLWKPVETGWDTEGALQYAPYRPTLRVVADYEIEAFKQNGMKSPNIVALNNGHEIMFSGFNIECQIVAAPSSELFYEWRNIILGNGNVVFRDCEIRNKEANGLWRIAGTAGRPLSVLLHGTTFTSLTADDVQFFAEGARLDVWASSRLEGSSNPTSLGGLTYKGGHSPTDIQHLISNRNTAVSCGVMING